MGMRDLPRSKRPLRFEKYCAVRDVLKEAAGRFSALGHDDLAGELESILDRLWLAWDKIVAAEKEGR